MNPSYLATLVLVGSNKTVYMPPYKDIFQRTFSKQGKLLEADLVLDMTEAATSCGV